MQNWSIHTYIAHLNWHHNAIIALLCRFEEKKLIIKIKTIFINHKKHTHKKIKFWMKTTNANKITIQISKYWQVTKLYVMPCPITTMKKWFGVIDIVSYDCLHTFNLRL